MRERGVSFPGRRTGSASAPSAARAVAFAALLVVAVPVLAQSASPPWTMPTPHAPNTFLSANVQRFAEDLEAVSAGRIRIEVRSGGRLVAHDDIEEAVRKGEVPIGELVLSRLASRVALFGADTVPFLATGYRKAERLWQASRAAIARRLEERNLVLLFAVPVPPPVLLARSPLEDDSALRGLELRGPLRRCGRGAVAHARGLASSRCGAGARGHLGTVGRVRRGTAGRRVPAARAGSRSRGPALRTLLLPGVSLAAEELGGAEPGTRTRRSSLPCATPSSMPLAPRRSGAGA